MIQVAFACFIILVGQESGKPITVNVDAIKWFRTDENGGSRMKLLDAGDAYVKEHPAEIEQKIRSTCGGSVG